MDAAAIAVRVEAESDSVSVFVIERILKGDDLLDVDARIRMNYFGQAADPQRFLVMGIDPPNLLWSSPLQVSEKAIAYIDQVVRLPEDKPLERLRFFLEFLDDKDPVLSRDVYDEFASASYSDMLQLKEDYDREWLMQSVQDVDLPPDRRRLYLVMLGICGQSEDADELEKMLKSDDPNQRSGLDALISCYISLKGVEGLTLINDLYLSNLESSYADTYAAIMALRFHGTDGGIIEREPVIESLRLILDRPELADLVIPDLARWEDWSVIEKMAELFRTADEKSSWVRVPVINYLRACPLPEANAILEELKEIDPVAFRRATQFFPVPQPSEEESSFNYRELVPGSFQDRRILLTDMRPRIHKPVPSADTILSARDRIDSDAITGARPEILVNPLSITSVISTVCATLWLAMWLAISGAGRQSPWLIRMVQRLL